MRYIIAVWLLLVVLVIGLAGFRGDTSRRPPLEVFPDMDRQPKLRPQEPNAFFANGISSQLPVEGTVARSAPVGFIGGEESQPIFAYDDAPVNTGRLTGQTNYVETVPVEVTAAVMERGRDRYQIYCAPCHGLAGNGKGVTQRLGMAVVANLHDPRILRMPDGEIFDVITHGRNLMGSYASQIVVEDRWAVVAYVRALQMTRVATSDDVPQEERANLR